MVKVGIVTTFHNVNYGSKLQSYALQRILSEMGFIGENISWQGKTPNPLHKRIERVLSDPHRYVARILRRSEFRKRRILFDRYQKKFINVSNMDIDQVKEEIARGKSPYLYYICGSDQIWAPNLFNEIFFLSFVKDSAKTVAYAPSIGLPEIPDNLIGRYRELINDIDSVSVREEDGALLVHNITGRNVPVVLDPTMLLTSDQWKSHMVKQQIDSPYILSYFLGNNKRHRQWVDRLSKYTGYKVVVLPFQLTDLFWGDERRFDVGPQEFLGLIDGASIVCTDSYHGVLFSVNLNKEFYAFLRFNEREKLNQNSRVLNFLDRIDMSDRIVDPSRNPEISDINWSVINEKIALHRSVSRDYLRSSLF